MLESISLEVRGYLPFSEPILTLKTSKMYILYKMPITLLSSLNLFELKS
jgi:hypothetical protein